MGGVRRHNQELLPRLAALLKQAGGELAVLVPRGGLPFELGSHARLVPTNIQSTSPALRWLQETRATITEVRAAEKRGQPYDDLHAAHLPAARLPRPLADRIQRTHMVHDLRLLESGRSSPFRNLCAKPILKRALSNATQVFTVSETVRAQLIERQLVAPHRCVVVPNAGDHFVPRERHPEPDSPLLHVGHLEPRKNLQLLVKALALAPDLPPLQLVGAAKQHTDKRLFELAVQLGVADRLQFRGSVSDIELLDLYARAACVVIPSSLEGFGIGVLEAQLARVPLAVSTAGALPEVAGADCPMFAPDNVQACVNAIRKALTYDSEDLQRGFNNAQQFTWDNSAQRFYDNLVDFQVTPLNA